MFRLWKLERGWKRVIVEEWRKDVQSFFDAFFFDSVSKRKKKKRKDRFLSFSKNVLINIYRSRFQAQSSDNETIKTLNRIQRKPRGLKEVWLANRVTVWSSIKRRIRDSCSSHVPVKMNSLGIKLCLSSFPFFFKFFDQSHVRAKSTWKYYISDNRSRY